MEQLARFIMDERTGLKYELCGDYYIIAGEDETERTLYEYLLQLNRDAEDMFNRLVKQMAEREGATEQLKADNQMEWVRQINNIRSRATEIVNADLINI